MGYRTEKVSVLHTLSLVTTKFLPRSHYLCMKTQRDHFLLGPDRNFDFKVRRSLVYITSIFRNVSTLPSTGDIFIRP